MKNKFQNMFKLAMLLLLCFMVGIASAQQTTGDVTKETDIDPGTTTTGGAVRVIDNKGTKKYLQVKNGLTIISNTTNDVTTTTWQLGGELSDSTDIDLNGNAFTLQNVPLSTDTAATAADADAADGGAAGYTILVRNELTGAIEKILATDLIQSGHQAITATAGQTAYPITTGGTPLPSFEQVWVYRNGAKLVANTDYTVSGSTVTLVPNTTAPNDWEVYAGDVIEVQFIK
jgi:hypothetical protein